MSLIDIGRKFWRLRHLHDHLDEFYDPPDRGTALITGDLVADTYGPWQQMVAATSEDRWLIGFVGEFDVADNYTIEMSTGAALSEVPLETEFKHEAQAVDTEVNLGCKEKFVPAGARVAARTKTTGGGSSTITESSLKWRKY